MPPFLSNRPLPERCTCGDCLIFAAACPVAVALGNEIIATGELCGGDQEPIIFNENRLSPLALNGSIESMLGDCSIGLIVAIALLGCYRLPEGLAGSLKDVAHDAGWESAKSPGKWRPVTRTFRDGSTQVWWVLEIVAGPYGPDKTERAVVATTDPYTLPDLTTWYLVTNLPAPSASPAIPPAFARRT